MDVLQLLKDTHTQHDGAWRHLMMDPSPGLYAVWDGVTRGTLVQRMPLSMVGAHLKQLGYSRTFLERPPIQGALHESGPGPVFAWGCDPGWRVSFYCIIIACAANQSALVAHAPLRHGLFSSEPSGLDTYRVTHLARGMATTLRNLRWQWTIDGLAHDWPRRRDSVALPCLLCTLCYYAHMGTIV